MHIVEEELGLDKLVHILFMRGQELTFITHHSEEEKPRITKYEHKVKKDI